MSQAAINAMGDLPDVNVWVALGSRNHMHHGAAQAYWTRYASRHTWFCRHTVLGMLRLLCVPSVMREQVKTSAQSWQVYQTMRQTAGVNLLPEPPTLEEELSQLIQEASWNHRHWPDAYLAAFARAAGVRLVSFDRDFSRFSGLQWLHLNPESLETSP